ncbi:MAG: hypothetical protein IJX38_04695 [Clostridia bacterium]|nr:hypothetical protein [Clostridia bacterium]
MNRILVITDGESDLLSLLRAHCDVKVISTREEGFDDSLFDALCILAGNSSAWCMSAPMHVCVERMMAAKKPVICEFVSAIHTTRARKTVNTERQRMVYYSHGDSIDTLKNGDLLDGRSNDCMKYAPISPEAYPILTYREDICAHTNIEISPEEHKEGDWALWWLNSSTLISSIRICNFRRARLAPIERWRAVISMIVSFLAGERVELAFEPPVCTYRTARVNCAADTDAALRRGLDWITNAKMLKNGGRGGVHEGFKNSISAKDGEQAKNCNIRTDCTCEIGGALKFDALLTGNAASDRIANTLFDFAFEWLQIKEGAHRGMLRWSEAGWDDCFADDVARAVIPMLLCQHLGCEVPHLDGIVEALDYLVATTGEDGIRTPCTSSGWLTPERAEELKRAGSGEPCAHFNAYYHAALLLAYRVCGKREYLECAERGLSTLMSVYPDTRRETSETEECARLVFPLAALYGVSGKREHYDWLCRVVCDLEARHHPFGGYAEWDTGYKAACSRNHKGECALLADNGDPVADLLYTNNWLPLGFSYAYMVTGEQRFYDLWTSIASFLLSTQIHSEDKSLDGAWARAFDMDEGENYGMPHDAGWGPCCIESGWTVGEILIGLEFMHIAERNVAREKGL